MRGLVFITAAQQRPSAALLLGCHPQRTYVYASGVSLRCALHLGTSERPRQFSEERERGLGR